MWPFTDFVVTMLALAAVLLGGGYLGSKWLLWSKRRRANQAQAERHIEALLEWVEQLSTEQRMEHLHQRVRKRKRERQVVH